MPKTRRRKALLFLNGELGPEAPVRAAARACDALLCADGGARHAIRLGLEPRVVIGDMDSLPNRLPPWRRTVYLCDFDPDRSDFEKALRFAAEQGFAEAWIAGAWGPPDYLLVNFAVAERYGARLSIRLLGRPQARLLGPGAHRLDCRRGRRLTLVSSGPRARLSTRGLLYPLSGDWLDRGSRGLSNRATGRGVSLRVDQGRLWAFF